LWEVLAAHDIPVYRCHIEANKHLTKAGLGASAKAAAEEVSPPTQMSLESKSFNSGGSVIGIFPLRRDCDHKCSLLNNRRKYRVWRIC
jgi:hypothetical protein